MKSLKEIREAVKASKQEGTKFKVRVPVPDKEFAKDNGAKWDKDMGSYVVTCPDIKQHPLKDYWVDSGAWVKIVGVVPYDYRTPLKEHGLVNEQANGEWANWILLNEKYNELIETLVDLDLIRIEGNE